LHDEVGQALTAISINLAEMKKQLPSELSPQIRERLAEAISLTDQIWEQIRELSLDLHPALLDDLGLVSAVRWYADRYVRRQDTEVSFEAIGFEERLNTEIETTLYRIVQEALTNITRHAEASKVCIRLERQESTVAAIIEDDGRGFDVEQVARREGGNQGVGLLGIRERVSSLGGSFSIRSHPGQGTRLQVEIPYPRSGDYEPNQSVAGRGSHHRA